MGSTDGNWAASLLELNDRLRDVTDLAAMAFISSEIVASALGATAAGYGTMDADEDGFVIDRDWSAPQVANIAGRYRMRDFGTYHHDLRQGLNVVIPDVRLDPRTVATVEALEGAGGRSFVNLPVIESRRMVAVFFVLNTSPRQWTVEELAFIRDAAERTRTAIERRRAEHQLRVLNASLEQEIAERTQERNQLWQVSQDIFCISNFAGEIMAINPAWTRVLGWTEAEIVGHTSEWLEHPEDRRKTRAEVEHLAAGHLTHAFEHRLRTTAGDYRTLSWTCVPAGELIYSTARDVTHEQAQAKALRLYRDIVESDASPVLAFDTERRLIGFNQTHRDQFRQVMGLEQRVGDTLPDLFPADQATALRAFMDRALAGEAFTIVQEFGDREKPTWEIAYTPLRDDTGKIVGAFHHARDISARVQAEAERDALQDQLRQSQKMEAVGQLTGGLAHDFNNLLAIVSGSLEMLERRVLQGRVADIERFVTSAQAAAKRATALTHRLLAFSRRQTLNPRSTGVNQLVKGMHDLLRRTVGPSIAVETVGAAGLWNTLVDPSQLENALLNLCINARDAMPDGGRLTVETANRRLDERAAKERDVPPGQYVSLCVSDTGTGMPADVIARAFEPFFTTKPLGQGTGLGLSMIYGFARQSGGQVRIYSEVGQGTTVCVYLPRHCGEADESGEAAQPAPETALEGETVLVVDDEPGVRMLVVEVLNELGYRVIEAEDGPSALKVLSSKARIDLLVTDVGLPNGMNGRQVADAARVARPGLKVLFVTGYAENAAVGNGHLEPGMAVITKPFAVDVLANRIKGLIAHASDAGSP